MGHGNMKVMLNINLAGVQMLIRDNSPHLHVSALNNLLNVLDTKIWQAASCLLCIIFTHSYLISMGYYHELS